MEKYEFTQFCNLPERFKEGLLEQFPETHLLNLFCTVFYENGAKGIYPVSKTRQDFLVLKSSDGKDIYVPFEESFEIKMKGCGKYSLYGCSGADKYYDARKEDFRIGIENSIKRVFQRYLEKIIRIDTGNFYEDEWFDEDSLSIYENKLDGVIETALFTLSYNFYNEDKALRTIMFWYIETWVSSTGTSVPDFKYIINRRSFFEEEYKKICEENK